MQQFATVVPHTSLPAAGHGARLGHTAMAICCSRATAACLGIGPAQTANTAARASLLWCPQLSGSAHVADLLDFVETPAKIHTFLELVPGGELYDQLRLEPYTEAEAREHFRQMMLGMAHVHERGIVHRDIKPENILMMEPSRTAAIKIVDFGFAERVPKGGQLFERLGTPKYVAPEVWRADDRRGRGYGTNADIYAFGIILHQMLTGQEPFDYVKARWARAHPPEADQSPSEDRTQEFSEWAASHNVPPMTETRAPEAEKITPEARDLIVRLLVRDPASRITAAEALEHAWFRAAPRPEPLVEAAERIKQFQARKRMMKAMNAVLFTARVKNVVGRLRQAAPRQSTGDSDAALGVLDDPAASDSPSAGASKSRTAASDRLAGPSPTARGSATSEGGARTAGVLVSGASDT